MCLSSVLSHFPAVKFGFAYGSGAIKQSGYDYTLPASRLPMIDFIFVVESTADWHRLNKAMNPSHYTSLLPFSPKMMAYIQDNMGAGVWFNTAVEVPIEQQVTDMSDDSQDNTSKATSSMRLIKYGVISLENFYQDLTQWQNVYIAGRLHKPVQTLTPLTDDLERVMQQNRDYALCTALYLLPPAFTELELYMKIASLSYTGDPRMGIGENPRKVSNLVAPALPLYRQLYAPSIVKVLRRDIFSDGQKGDGTTVSSSPYLLASETYHHHHHNNNNDHNDDDDYDDKSVPVASFTLNQGVSARGCMVGGLPSALMRRIKQQQGASQSIGKAGVQRALTQLVRRGAGVQTLKGVITIGLVKSLLYAMQKITKRFS